MGGGEVIIALYNIEPTINNTALMKISQYHKNIGNTVEWYAEIFRDNYDIVYCSSLFDFTDKSDVPKDAICGGTGFDIKSKLPEEIERCDLDYSIYPECKSSYVWFSRGCVRNCPFCIVREKEGLIYPTEPTNLNPNGEVIEIMDNNFFANKKWQDAEKYLIEWNKPINFNSGIDVRIFEPLQAEFLNKFKVKTVHIAWDNPKHDLIPKLKEIIKYIKPYKIMCYVLIGYWSNETEDLSRVMKLKELGISPYAMPYNKKDTYQKRFARWVNHKAIFKTVKWEDYGKVIEDKTFDAQNWWHDYECNLNIKEVEK